MNRKLKNSLKKYDKSKQNRDILISGELGITLGGNKLVEVPNRKGFVYVRLKGNTSEVIQAYNAAVAQIYGMPVFVVRSKGIYKVVGRNIDRYQNQFGNPPYLPKHGPQHSFNKELGIGGDIVWIYSQQFMPLLSYPSGTYGSMTVSVQPHFYEWNGQWRYSQNTGTPSYTPYLPTITGSARMVLSYLDPSDNSIKLVPGTPFSNSLTGSSQIAQYIPDIPREVGIPLAAVRLVTGTTTIGWENIYDLRDFYTVGKPSGSTGGGAGGIGGIIAQDEGVFLGTGTVFNFVGPNVDASISGTVVRVFVTGSSGGGATIITQDLTQYISGSNQVFPLLSTPIANTLRLFYNGVRQRPTYHYTVAGSQVTTTFVPTTGSVMIADYNEASITGSASAITIKDEGSTLGNFDSINFVGQGVEASLVGSAARVFVTGSSPSYIKWYQNGSIIGVSGTTNEITLFSGSFPGGVLGYDGSIYIDSLVDLNHAVVGTATLKLYYGSNSLSISLAEGAVTASKVGRITFRLGEKGSANSQFVEGQTQLADGSNMYWKRNASVFNTDSSVNQRLQLTVQWGTSSNGLAYIQHHINVGYYP